MEELFKNYRQEISLPQMEIDLRQAQQIAEDLKHSQEKVRKLFTFIDLTFLNITDNATGIAKVTRQVNHVKHVLGIDNVACLMVYPRFVPTIKNNLEDETVNIGAVVGDFPSSQTFLEVKTLETKLAVETGADEVDMVISVGEFLDGRYELVMNEIKAIREQAKDKILKVILESGTLADVELIYKAAILAMESGADFIKTSTGKEKVGATPEAVYIMALAVKDFYDLHGKKVGIKPAGGVSSVEKAMTYWGIIQTVLGEQWINNRLFRIGSSSLANKVLQDLKLIEDKFFYM